MRGYYAVPGTIALFLTLLSGCVAPAGPVANRGFELRINYAEVTQVERVPLESAVPAGAVLGGFTGLVIASRESPGRQISSGITGAALGALVTAALEGDHLGYAYTLRYADDSFSRFVTEKAHLQVGDCVAVERGRYANIRRVPDSLCHSGRPILQIDEFHQQEARQCDIAKEQLLNAVTNEEVEAAARKVEILCEY